MARGSVTPQRRGRDDDEDEAEQPRKRARSGEDVLPDSFRRSPKNQRQQYQPGSIVRVSLENFVTYSKSEFFPGPHLNMVIGPNGTGKSTLVCAICLGLGWSPKHLGRAKHISEFVKHGSKVAKIEIELAADPAKHDSNPIIRTRISHENETPDFYINGSKVPKKQVQSLARSFAIQVDNLCQFLPQDRVAEFATLSPVRLLEETQRAAAPEEMSQWHASLIELGKEQKDQVTEQQRLMEQLKSLDARQRVQQADVERLKQRTTLQTRLAMLEKVTPFPKYRIVKAEYKEVKRAVRASNAECTQLEQALEPRLKAVADKEAYILKIDEALQPRKRVVDRHETARKSKLQRCDTSEEEIELHKQERAQQTKKLKEFRQQRAKIEHDIQKLQRDMQIVPPPFDAASMNVEARDKTRQIRVLEDQKTEIDDKISTMRAQNNQKSARLSELTNQKERMQSQIGQQSSRLAQISPGAGKAWDWIQDNRDKFTGPVFGPPIIECSIKDKRHTAGIESIVGGSFLLTFTVTNKPDYNTLQQVLYGQLNVDAHAATVDMANYRRRTPCSDEEAKQLGLHGWLVDLIDGPAEVITMLCDNSGIDSTAYSNQDLSLAQNQALLRSSINSWVTPRESSSVTRRPEYGDQATSTRVDSLKAARFFTATPVNRDAEDHINREMRDLQADMDQLKHEINAEQIEQTTIKDQIRSISEERAAIVRDKDAKQKVQQAFDGLPTRIEGEQSKLTACDEKLAQLDDEIKGFEKKANQLQLKLAQAVIEYANNVEHCRGLHMQVLEAEILKIEAQSDVDQLKQQDQSERQQLATAQQELERLTTEKDKLYNEATQLGRDCKAISDAASEEELAVIDEVSNHTVEQLQVEIESTQAQLEMHTGGNMNIIREFEERGRKIEQRQMQLAESRENLEALKQKIADIRGRWEPQLDEIIGRISTAFSENFAAISCAGEVSVYKDDDEFDKWAIQIRVKFRDSETLSVLDSHRQSGGERSVSTIFYLMALQSLARAPFRVVDEINQGMDPRNERMVHSRLVSIACEARREDGGGGSQYFLITPKLLTGLEYHENMKIHCIASGEWMPSDQSSLNFNSFAQQALAIRAS